MKKTIWMNDPLIRLQESLPDASSPKNRRSGGFSQRLGDVVERYEIMLKLTPAPALTEEETMIMSEVVCGSMVSDLSIKYMQDSILDAATGTAEERKALSEKAAGWSPTERLALIESMGQ
ncbi:hypothetical protein [Acetonema longum]|uniref:Phage protein n=1 Tax=Acetonema longum DSM 6540 TaxID=1009370 RepID=F7NK80_9FIRM|nr:hypothetical protein [Acetonema longum]EGO63521.1 phage protein [Acetonema longum DSM 6540]